MGLWVPLLGAAVAAAEMSTPAPSTAGAAPWSSDQWLFDLNGAMPVLSSGDFRLNGELSGGYNTDHWGGVLRGGYLSYALSSNGTTSTIDRTDGSGEGWWVAKLSPELRLELRGAASYTGYNTQNTLTTAGGTSGELERARMLRGAGLAGLRYIPSERFALALAFGLGVQRERYDIVSVPVATNASVINLPDVRDTTVTEEAHARLQWNAIPGALSIRFRADLRLFQLSHHVHDLTVDASGNVGFSNGGSTSMAVDSVFRFSFDFDKASFYGFIPSAVAGVNLVSLSGGDGGLGIAPTFGIGLRRESF